MVQEIAESSKEEWDIPKFSSLHWDSKLMSQTTDQNILKEHLTVVVETADQLKLLGVPKYQPGTDQSTGEITAKLTHQEEDCVSERMEMFR